MICFLEENGCFFEKMKFDNIGVSQFNNIFVFLYFFTYIYEKRSTPRFYKNLFVCV